MNKTEDKPRQKTSDLAYIFLNVTQEGSRDTEKEIKVYVKVRNTDGTVVEEVRVRVFREPGTNGQVWMHSTSASGFE